MRDILFRGKRIDNGEWVYGDLYHGKEDNIFIEYWTVDKEYRPYEVDPKTVGQYTGLDDCKDNKIFEGDIVKYQLDNDDCLFLNKNTKPIIGKIFFSDFRASFSVTAGRNGSTSMNNDLFRYVRGNNRVKVIGNISDNPELLEVKQNDN